MSDSNFLVCVDSDGCVMDTMNSKHIYCFGPCLVEEWKLEKWSSEILSRWNSMNLYQVTRGINRFQGLAKMLREVHEKYREIHEIELLEDWVTQSSELSNQSLQETVRKTGSSILNQALHWSEEVNRKIEALPLANKQPFRGALPALAAAHDVCDVAVVSSANLQAVEEEWQRCQLLVHVDRLMTQNEGSKASCIEKLRMKGYQPEHVLMVGDSMGDYEAAKRNGVYFFPILVGHETTSWQEFVKTALSKLLCGEYAEYQAGKLTEFTNNFI